MKSVTSGQILYRDFIQRNGNGQRLDFRRPKSHHRGGGGSGQTGGAPQVADDRAP
jgi:hypothetical protein